jgi:hypothetical protein
LCIRHCQALELNPLPPTLKGSKPFQQHGSSLAISLISF